MSTAVTTSMTTVLDAIFAAIETAAEYHRESQVPPAAVLWTDKDRQWEGIVPILRDRLSHFLVLGDYDEEMRTGPAIWLRCMVGRSLPEAQAWDANVIPILYLPGVGRDDLRAIDDCPKHLQPLAELQFRSTFFSHKNGKDWTITAFLRATEFGMGLDVAADRASAEALQRCLPQLADARVAELRGHKLEGCDFDALLTPDPVRETLRWLNEPARMKQEMAGNRWQAFRSIMKDKYGFDPDADGELTAAERMGAREGAWKSVWMRFAEAPHHYPSIPALLARAKPSTLFPEHPDSWPQINDEQESALRSALSSLERLNEREGAKKVVELEQEHGGRRAWVWSQLGRSPLAQAIRWLADLGQAVRESAMGDSPEQMASTYVASGWKADRAALRAFSSVKSQEDREAVKSSLRTIYMPWLAATAAQLQKAAAGIPIPISPRLPDAIEGQVVLFADGLRYDVAMELSEALAMLGIEMDISWRWAALPTVTPTAKPAVSPVVELLEGNDTAEGFLPTVATSGKLVSSENFKNMLQSLGFQVLADGELGKAGVGRAWTEGGAIDRRGHELQAGLAFIIQDEVERLAVRIQSLIKAGWNSVQVVTDHGWILMPGGLPKTDLPGYLAHERWGRCATVKEAANVELPSVSWRWSSAVQIRVAPGISAFYKGVEYAHGGVSLQECVIPVITISTSQHAVSGVAIGAIRWVNLRCRVQLTGSKPEDYLVDVRTKPGDAGSSVVASPKAFDKKGEAGIVVPDEKLEGAAVHVVVVDKKGVVVAKLLSTVGGGD